MTAKTTKTTPAAAEKAPRSRAQLTQEALWLAALAAAATSRAQAAREELAEIARTELAVERIAPTWRMPDLATVVTRTKSGRFTITDPAAYAAWVAAEHPEQMETVVRSKFSEVLLKTMERVNRRSLTGIDKATGQTVPGVTYEPGGAFHALAITADDAASGIFADVAVEALATAVAVAGPLIDMELADLFESGTAVEE